MSIGGKWDRRQTRKTPLTHVSSGLKQTVIAFWDIELFGRKKRNDVVDGEERAWG